jgi:5-methylcytosine-specific restriction endonuclease McrA
MNDFCQHPRRELRRRIDVGGRSFYQHQCQDCGFGVGSAVAASVALADGRTPPPFDESIEAKWRLEADRLREERRGRRRQAYDAYLQSDAWRAKRAQALARDHGVCQGCLSRPATQVHHRTYEHVGDELLFELVSLCDECHERAHASSALVDSINESERDV